MKQKYWLLLALLLIALSACSRNVEVIISPHIELTKALNALSWGRFYETDDQIAYIAHEPNRSRSIRTLTKGDSFSRSDFSLSEDRDAVGGLCFINESALYYIKRANDQRPLCHVDVTTGESKIVYEGDIIYAIDYKDSIFLLTSDGALIQFLPAEDKQRILILGNIYTFFCYNGHIYYNMESESKRGLYDLFSLDLSDGSIEALPLEQSVERFLIYEDVIYGTAQYGLHGGSGVGIFSFNLESGEFKTILPPDHSVLNVVGNLLQFYDREIIFAGSENYRKATYALNIDTGERRILFYNNYMSMYVVNGKLYGFDLFDNYICYDLLKNREVKADFENLRLQ